MARTEQELEATKSSLATVFAALQSHDSLFQVHAMASTSTLAEFTSQTGTPSNAFSSESMGKQPAAEANGDEIPAFVSLKEVEATARQQ